MFTHQFFVRWFVRSSVRCWGPSYLGGTPACSHLCNITTTIFEILCFSCILTLVIVYCVYTIPAITVRTSSSSCRQFIQHIIYEQTLRACGRLCQHIINEVLFDCKIAQHIKTFNRCKLWSVNLRHPQAVKLILLLIYTKFLHH